MPAVVSTTPSDLGVLSDSLTNAASNYASWMGQSKRNAYNDAQARTEMQQYQGNQGLASYFDQQLANDQLTDAQRRDLNVAKALALSNRYTATPKTHNNFGQGYDQVFGDMTHMSAPEKHGQDLLISDKLQSEIGQNNASAYSSYQSANNAGRTSAMKNAEAMGLVPGTPEYNEFIRGNSSGVTVNTTVGGAPPYKIPTGMMLVDPNDPGLGVKPIPGSGTATATEGAKTALVVGAKKQIPQIRAMLFDENGDYQISPVLTMQAGKLMGFDGMPWTEGRNLNRLMKDVVEAKLRAESGAAVPEDEVVRISERFMPSAADTGVQVRDKMDKLESFMDLSLMSIYDGNVPQWVSDSIESSGGTSPTGPSSAVNEQGTVPRITSDAEYEDDTIVPPGTYFIGPDGVKRLKPEKGGG